MEKEDAKKFLYSIAEDLGFTDIEGYTCKDGEKMRDAIKILEQELCKDAISRAEALKIVDDINIPEDMSVFEIKSHICVGISTLPPVTPQPSKDCISREDLKERKFIIAENDYQKGWNDALDAVYENASSIHQKKGRWITKPHVYGVTYCSKCGFELKIDNTKYCPNCGRWMQEVEE